MKKGAFDVIYSVENFSNYVLFSLFHMMAINFKGKVKLIYRKLQIISVTCRENCSGTVLYLKSMLSVRAIHNALIIIFIDLQGL